MARIPRAEARTFAVLLALVLAACGQDVADDAQDPDPEGDPVDDDIEEVTLGAVIAWETTNDLQRHAFDRFQEETEAISGGNVQVELIGGPESIPPFDLAEAVRGGDVDMAYLSAAYYIPDLPEAAALDYTELTAPEERESGGIDYLDEIHRERFNVTLLGRGSWVYGYAIYTSNPVEGVDDFQDMRLRVSPSYIPFTDALGAESVTMPPGDIYTALERGVIEGYTWPEVGIPDLGTAEVTDYKILPSYWNNDNVFLINLDFWESLSDEVQGVLQEAVLAVEADQDFYRERVEEENAELEEAGVEIIELEGEEADRYLELAREAGWDWIRENAQDDPERLIELFSE